MNQIDSDKGFRTALDALCIERQRAVAALFVDSHDSESQTQYQILTRYLDA